MHLGLEETLEFLHLVKSLHGVEDCLVERQDVIDGKALLRMRGEDARCVCVMRGVHS